MDRIVDLWSARSTRERVLAVAAAAVIVVGIVVVLALGSDEGTATVTATDVAADINPDGTSGSTQVPPGAVVAKPVRPQEGVPPPTAGGVAPIAGGGGGGDVATDTSAEDAALLSRMTSEMNRGWKDVPAVKGVDEVPTTTAVAAAGAELERIANEFNECLEDSTEHLRCLKVLPDDMTPERIFESDPKGLVISRQADFRTVRLVFRGDTFCRMLDDGPSCTAWSATG